jgi:tellurite resistance protein
MLHLVVGVATVRRMLDAPNEPAMLTPPILIPLVGNLVAPLVGIRLGFETLSWLLFGVGIMLWLVLQPLVLHRLMAGPKLPPRLRPTLAILLAPPSVAFLGVAGLSGSPLTPAALALFGLAAFVALVLVSLVPEFLKVPFAPSWWAWTFPPAAFATAAIRMAGAVPHPLTKAAALALLAGVSAVAALVTWRTLRAAVSGELLQPER